VVKGETIILVTQPRVIQVTDELERRIRKPIDALRCITSCVWIFVLAVAAVAASATTTGVETDIVGASKRLPHALLIVVPSLALFALFILPAALAVAQLFRRQARTLVEAVATGLLASIAAQVANVVLERHVGELYYAVIMSRPGASHIHALDPYLAGLIAYTTIIGLSGRSGWRNALALTICAYVVAELTVADTTILAILITVLAGRVVGLAVRYGAGSISLRPSAADIAAALSAEDLAVTSIRRERELPGWAAGSRLYDVVTDGDDQLDAVVFDRDQQAAGAFYRLYRWIRVRGQVSRAAPLSVERTVERRALMSYAALDAGAPTPRLRALVRVGSEAVVLAYDQCQGTTLAQRNPGCTDEEIRSIWDAVGELHAHHVTHRALTADRILFTGEGRVMLLDPGDGDVAASDIQMRLDTAQLIAELALYVGPERSVRLAVEKVGAAGLVTVLPLLQPVALARSTRHELRRRRDVLPAVRKELLAAVPAGEVTPVQLERIRPRALVTLVASVAAAYLLAGELAQASLGRLLPSADWRWGLAALALSALTYAAATFSLSGFVAERLSFTRTLLVQVASSFVSLVTPAAVGGAALNVRYLQRKKIPAPAAVASVGVSQVVAFVLHILMIASFAAIAGSGSTHPIRPPTWAYFVVAGLVALAGAVLAIPAGRRMVRARLSPTFGQVIPRLVEVAQRPRKLVMGFGGAITLSLAYIFCLASCVAAFGGPVPIAKIGVVYLTGATLGSIIPTPGGLGTVEAVLTAGLTTAGVHGAVALSAVLLFRLLTFWLPVPIGWVALNTLERHHDLLPGLTAAAVSPPGPRPPCAGQCRVSAGCRPSWPGTRRRAPAPSRGPAARGPGRRPRTPPGTCHATPGATASMPPTGPTPGHLR
jgi:glycosyltransferase 2 family protein